MRECRVKEGMATQPIKQNNGISQVIPLLEHEPVQRFRVIRYIVTSNVYT